MPNFLYNHRCPALPAFCITHVTPRFAFFILRQVDMCGCSAHHTINKGKHEDIDGATGSERLHGLQEIRYGTACCS